MLSPKTLLPKLIVALFLTPIVLNLLTIAAASQNAIPENELDARYGFKWGGPDLPYSKPITFLKPTTGVPTGKVVVDRDGSDEGLIKAPFAGPYPKRSVILSFWGKKREACYVEILIQFAPPIGFENDTGYVEKLVDVLVPESLEVGVGNQEVTLKPQRVDPKIRVVKYVHTEYKYENSQSVKYDTVTAWLWSRRVFIVNAQASKLFGNAPYNNVKILVTSRGGQQYLAEIGKETVKAWKEVYGSNPSCRP